MPVSHAVVFGYSERLPVAHTVPVKQYILRQFLAVVHEPCLDTFEYHAPQVLNYLACCVAWLKAHRPEEFAGVLVDRTNDGRDGRSPKERSLSGMCYIPTICVSGPC